MNAPEPDDDSLELPARLTEELKASFGHPPVIPAEVDARVRSDAREHLRPSPPTFSSRLLLFPRWLAAAAAIVVAALVMWAPVESRKRDASRQVDLNGDGQVDILDSYQLARRLQQGEKLSSSLDLNGDGLVDAKDLEALTARVVQLGRDKG
jgi:hypothetical protein